MAKIKTRGIIIKRRDLTVPQTKDEEKKAKALNNPNYRTPKQFIVRINAEIPASHRICEGGAIAL